MKKTVFIIVVILGIIISGCKKDNPIQPGTDPAEIQGKWIGYIDGKSYDMWTLDFYNNHANAYGTIINNHMDWFVGIMNLQTNTNPKIIDIKINDCSDSTSINKTSFGIFQISGDSLFIVSNAPGYPVRPTSFTDSKARKFITIKEYRVKVIPPIPTLLLPDNKATNISFSPEVNWNKFIEASSYSLQVSFDSGFTSIVFKDSLITDTKYSLRGLLSSKQYWWRVNGRNSYGISSWSNPGWSFTVLTAPVKGIPCPGIPTVTYSGQVYNTLQIRNQCWLKENLNVGTMINGSLDQQNNGVIEKYCYNNDTAMCSSYGGLYQWNEAMQYAPGGTHVQGICPPGWHIPDSIEYCTLLDTSRHWNSNFFIAIGQIDGSAVNTNYTGFSALLTGFREINGAFNGLRDETHFWSSADLDALSTYLKMSLYYDFIQLYTDKKYMEIHTLDKSEGFSVRCLRD